MQLAAVAALGEISRHISGHPSVMENLTAVYDNLLEAGEHELQLAIATTTSPVNIAALLRQAMGADWKRHFAVIEDASTAPRKKPDPMVYQQTLSRLGLPAPPCLAFEDSENGLRAALGAGLATVVTPNDFTAGHDFKGAWRVLPSLQGVGVAQLREWHALLPRSPA